VHVLPFSEENLSESLSNNFSSKELINSKNHFLYFKNYLGPDGLDAKTIVIEENYISKDYLDDYTLYYASCFQDYSKFCKRIHFFKSNFETQDFEQIIEKQDTEDSIQFWTNYLGFIVVKPIPFTVIGYTVLKTYSNGRDYNDRNFWGTRDYKIHVFGNEITINSLAFQEQDSVLAACATTAIWSMLNKASTDYHTILKSPSLITKDADNTSPDGSRLFPNSGLNLLQICQAILNSGLVSEIKQADIALNDLNGAFLGRFVSNHYLKKILNAYSAIGIPIILVIYVPNGGQHGLHAITVSGFKMKKPAHINPSDETSWISDNIETFYAHDDQWGPFARIKFIGDAEIETPWTVFDEQKRNTLVSSIVVPLYPKIRISFEDIEIIVLGLDRILSFFFDGNIKSDLIWDIKIEYSENFKKFIKTSNLDSEPKLNKLTTSQPKYVWIASCYVGEIRILDFTFDATNVKNGMIGLDVLSYLPQDIQSKLNEFLISNRDTLKTLINHRSSADYYSFIIDKMS
jgi:hypothetical protein